MTIRLWHNRRVTTTPVNDETGEPLYGPIQGVTLGDDLMEVHCIPELADEAMPKTRLEAASILNKVHEALDAEHISVRVGDVVQIEKRFWACEAIDSATRIGTWAELPLMNRMLMGWSKLSHSGHPPCSCPECLQLVLGEKDNA